MLNKADNIMQCPVDKKPMMVLEYHEVEVDYCVVCEGVWLDEGELELLLGSERTDAATLGGGEPTPAPGERKRRCPICGKKMLKEATPGDHPVTFDRCPRGHGLWFDRGELADVLRHGSFATAADDVAAFLRDLFPDDDQETSE